MKQICKFSSKPPTISKGGVIKGRHIAWLNLGVSEIEEPQENCDERWRSVTERLVLDGWSIETFLQKVDSLHLAMATNAELRGILSAFGVAEDLESWKAVRRLQIQGYDKSEAVNVFHVGSQSLWFDKATRVGLVNSMEIEKKAGKSETSVWCNGEKLTLGIDDALSMLYRLELYALECYDATARHLASVEASDSIEFLSQLDISEHYPATLVFPASD